MIVLFRKKGCCFHNIWRSCSGIVVVTYASRVGGLVFGSQVGQLGLVVFVHMSVNGTCHSDTGEMLMLSYDCESVIIYLYKYIIISLYIYIKALLHINSLIKSQLRIKNCYRYHKYCIIKIFLNVFWHIF